MVRFQASPQVIRVGETTTLSWEVQGAERLELFRRSDDGLPDDSQRWTCSRQLDRMVCTAPNIPSEVEGWSCDPVSGCARPLADDDEGWWPIGLGATAHPIGAIDLVPDATTAYRLEATDVQGLVELAWLQVVVAPSGGARIVLWTAWPAPALAGEEVTLTYLTSGCDHVEWATFPPLGSAELVEQEGSSRERGTILWREADATRDFYFGCHPVDGDESERLRARMTVDVIGAAALDDGCGDGLCDAPAEDADTCPCDCDRCESLGVDASCSACLSSACQPECSGCAGDHACSLLLQCARSCGENDEGCRRGCREVFEPGLEPLGGLGLCARESCSAVCGLLVEGA